MLRRRTFFQALSGLFTSLFAGSGAASPTEEVRRAVSPVLKPRNIIEFAEQDLGVRLFPAQRFLTKLYYDIPLDDREKTLAVTDMFNSTGRHRVTEKEYLRFLYGEGRCNIAEQDHPRSELILSIGRRSGGTMLSAVMAVYEVYRLLCMRDPHGYYGIKSKRLQVLSVSPDVDQASLIASDVLRHVRVAEFFEPYVDNSTKSFINFRTPWDIEQWGAGRHSVNRANGHAKVGFASKARGRYANGLRGSTNAAVFIDSAAFFPERTLEDVYNAVTPSTAAFMPKDAKGPPTGPLESRIALISTPRETSGKFHELFQLAMTGGPGSGGLLAVQLPTWEANPTIPPVFLKTMYERDSRLFLNEYGALFVESE
jgi:hypothetical protein